MKIKYIILPVVLAGVAWFGYHRFFAGMPMGGMPPGGPMPVSVAEVQSRDITLWNEFSGRLEAVDSVEIHPQVSGKLQAVHFEEGARVKKGDKLFTIDPRPFEADASRARAALTSAEATSRLAKINRERAAELVKTRAISQAEFDRRDNDLKVAEAALQTAKAALQTAELNVEYAHITAPVSGRVGRPEITVGNIVNTTPTPTLLTTIVSESPIYANFEADEKTFLEYIGNNGVDIKNIPVELSVGTEEGAPHKGKIKSFDNQLNTGSGTIRVRAVFNNENGALLPGLFARIRMGSPNTQQALLINDKAIGTDQSKKFVWLVGDDNKANWREIKIGPVADGLRVVTEGLQAGDKIIIGGIQRIMMPGTPVQPELVPMEGKPVDSGQPTDDKKKEAEHAQ